MPKSSGNSSNVTIYGVGSTVLATASFFEAGKSFISKIKADSSRQIEFDAINGHCPTLIPNPIHNTKPTTVNRYIPVEISLVLRDLIIFHAWGAKLAVETAAARTPRIVVNDIRLRLSSCRRLVGGAVDKTKEVLCVLPMLFTGDSVANIHLLREIAIAIVIALPITRCRIVLAASAEMRFPIVESKSLRLTRRSPLIMYVRHLATILFRLRPFVARACPEPLAADGPSRNALAPTQSFYIDLTGLRSSLTLIGSL